MEPALSHGHNDEPDIELSPPPAEDDPTEPHQHPPSRLPSLQTLHVPVPSRQSHKFPRRDKQVVGLKDAGTILGSSWKARRREFLSASHEIVNNESADTILYGPKRTTLVETIEEKEKQLRAKENRNPISLLLLGNMAAFKVMLLYLISLETIITCALTAGLIIYWYNIGMGYEEAGEAETWSGGGMDFLLVGFAVTSPVSESRPLG